MIEGAASAAATVGFLAVALDLVPLSPLRWRGILATYRKVGGIHFWRIGRLGGSVYIAKRRAA